MKGIQPCGTISLGSSPRRVMLGAAGYPARARRRHGCGTGGATVTPAQGRVTRASSDRTGLSAAELPPNPSFYEVGSAPATAQLTRTRGGAAYHGRRRAGQQYEEERAGTRRAAGHQPPKGGRRVPARWVRARRAYGGASAGPRQSHGPVNNQIVTRYLCHRFVGIRGEWICRLKVRQISWNAATAGIRWWKATGSAATAERLRHLPSALPRKRSIPRRMRSALPRTIRSKRPAISRQCRAMSRKRPAISRQRRAMSRKRPAISRQCRAQSGRRRGRAGSATMPGRRTGRGSRFTPRPILRPRSSGTPESGKRGG